MGAFLIPVILVSAIGLIAGILLSVASVLMAVPKDERAEAINDILPGANCGACGYSGCSGYASALSKGEAPLGKCSPGGEKVAKEIAAILGGGDVNVEYKVAVVTCLGSYDNTSDKLIYDGLKTCKAASMIAGGISSCRFGCLGLGDCANVCQSGAIDVCNGVAHILPELCTGCGKCAEICPKSIIKIVSKRKQAIVKCLNCDKGIDTKKVCSTGCIGCGKCMKVCADGAIKVIDHKAVINSTLCTACGKCVEVCPKQCIELLSI